MVVTIQPSEPVLTWLEPIVTIGSMAMTMPAWRRTPLLLSIIRNVGVLVHHTANAMAHIVAKHAVTVRLGERLNGITDVPDMVTGNSLLDGSLKAIARDLAQGLGLGRRGADEKRQALSPTQPSTTAPVSMEMISPSRRIISGLGIL